MRSATSSTHRRIDGSNDDFGPYFAGVKPAELLETINLVYPLRTCSGFNLPKRTRACLNYDLGLCSAPCVNKINNQQYKNDQNSSIPVMYASGQHRHGAG